MASLNFVCQELGIPAWGPDREVSPEEVEIMANTWADLTGEEFEVPDIELINLEELSETMDIPFSQILETVYFYFHHLVHKEDCYFAWLSEAELQELFDVLAEKYDYEYEIA